MAAAAILVFAFILPVLCYLNRACCEVPACQLSLISDDIWPSYSDLSEFKMAAAAILVFDFQLRFCVISIGHVVLYVHVKSHQDRTIFGRIMVICVNSRWRPPPSCFLFHT